MHLRPTISLLALLTIAGLVMAQEGSAPARGSGKAQGNKAKAKLQQPITITPEHEAAVMTFVERNHAEVGELLKHLKENQPAAYEQAFAADAPKLSLPAPKMSFLRHQEIYQSDV